jgi:hypothetical protein
MTEEAAEKGLCSREYPNDRPSVAKARLILLALSARLKSCPFKANKYRAKSSFSAACKARLILLALSERLKSCPFKANKYRAQIEFFRSL